MNKPFTVAEVAKWIQRAIDRNDPPRCPRCGCYQWIYKGDRQVCADCGR